MKGRCSAWLVQYERSPGMSKDCVRIVLIKGARSFVKFNSVRKDQTKVDLTVNWGQS